MLDRCGDAARENYSDLRGAMPLTYGLLVH